MIPKIELTRLKSIAKNRYDGAISALVNLSEFFSKQPKGTADKTYKLTLESLINVLKNKGKKDEYIKKMYFSLKKLAGGEQDSESSSLVKLFKSKKKEQLKLGSEYVKWNESINNFYFLLQYCKNLNDEYPKKSFKKEISFIPNALTSDEKKYLEEAEKRLKELKMK